MNKIHLPTKFTTLALIFILLLGVSCKSKKVTLIDESGKALKAKSHNEVLDDILEHQLDYKTITTKGTVTLKGKKVTTIFKIKKDEILQASIRPVLGVEVMRIDITPNKAVLIDRLEGRYAEIDIKSSELNDLVAFNFYNLQALLTNQLFLAGKHSVEKDNYKQFEISTVDNSYVLKTEDKNNISYNFSVDTSERITSTLVLSSKNEIALKWDYNQFVEDKGFVYPTDMTANMTFKKKKMAVGISYSNLDVNTDFNIDTSIPSKYKKVDIRELVGAYMNLK